MATTDKGKNEQILEYKGKPLIRCGSELYYGNMSDKYIIMLQVLDSSDMDDVKISGKVQVQLLLTDSDIRLSDRIIKKSEKQGLYNALDIGAIWLERAMAQK